MIEVLSADRAQDGGAEIRGITVLEDELPEQPASADILPLPQPVGQLQADLWIGIGGSFLNRRSERRRCSKQRRREPHGMAANTRVWVRECVFDDFRSHRTEAVERTEGVKTTGGVLVFRRELLQRWYRCHVLALEKQSLCRVALPTIRTVERGDEVGDLQSDQAANRTRSSARRINPVDSPPVVTRP